MKRRDKEEILAKAKTLAEEWLAAQSYTGEYDLDEICRLLSKRTHNGKPVLTLVVSSVEEAPTACAFGALSLSLLSGNTGQTETPEGQLGGRLRDQLGYQLRGQLSDQLEDQLSDQLMGQLGYQLGYKLGGRLRYQLGGRLRYQLGDQLRYQLWDQLRGQLRGQLWGQLWGQLRGRLRYQLSDQLGGQLEDQLRGQLRGQLWGQLGGQLGGQLWDQLSDQLRGQLGGQLRGQLWSQLRGQLKNVHQCIWDYYLMAFYSCAYRASSLDDPHEFAAYDFLPAFKAGLGHLINLGSLQVGVARPEAHRDERLNLHNETGPSIRWGSWEKYHWHGTEIPKEWVTDKDNLDPMLALTSENVEQRRAVAEIVGWHKVLEAAKAETLCTDKRGTLLQLDIDGHLRKFVTVTCPSTGHKYAHCVADECSTPTEAVAWMWGTTPEEFQPDVET